MDRDWVGLDADHYRERGGQFTRLDPIGNVWTAIDLGHPGGFERELISQYFGGIVRHEEPPDSIGEFVGYHVKLLGDQEELRISALQGIVGQWDTSLARTGHALGSGPSAARENQLGDGIYVVNPGGDPRDYQGLTQRSIVYRVYKMKGHLYSTRGDHDQTVFNDPRQFIRLCFVEQGRLPSVREQRERAETKVINIIPSAYSGSGEIPRDSSGKLNYSIF